MNKIELARSPIVRCNIEHEDIGFFSSLARTKKTDNALLNAADCRHRTIQLGEFSNSATEAGRGLRIPAECYSRPTVRNAILCECFVVTASQLYHCMRCFARRFWRSFRQHGPVSEERLDSFLRRCKRLDHCHKNVANISDIFSDADGSFFEAIMKNTYHHYVPETNEQ